MKKVNWTIYILIPASLLSMLLALTNIIIGNITIGVLFYAGISVWFGMLSSSLLQKREVRPVPHIFATILAMVIFIIVAYVIFSVIS